MTPLHHLVAKAADPSHTPAAFTVGAGGVTVAFWGLHVSDICMILSTGCTAAGLLLQFWLAMGRISRLERKQDAHVQVTAAVAEAVRVVDKNQKEQTNGD